MNRDSIRLNWDHVKPETEPPRFGGAFSAQLVKSTNEESRFGLIKHGQNVEIKQGTDLNSFVADEFSLVPVS
jgi:hypothetical protein